MHPVLTVLIRLLGQIPKLAHRHLNLYVPILAQMESNY